MRWSVLRPRYPRRGITLIEMLVVVSIIMLLAAFAIPALRPAMEGRRIREATRSFHVYLSRARIRAMETGRPCGVLLERFAVDPTTTNLAAAAQESRDVSLVVRQVEVPPPYAGDFETTRIHLRLKGNYITDYADKSFPNDVINPSTEVTFTLDGAVINGNRYGFTYQDGSAVGAVPDASTPVLWERLVKKGDFIQFNHQGTLYQITDVDDSEIALMAPHTNLREEFVNALQTADGLPFRVIRAPVVTGARPLGLPRGAVIDMSYSGTGKKRIDVDNKTDRWPKKGGPEFVDSFAPVPYSVLKPQFGRMADPIMVLFSPNGSVDKVYYSYTNSKTGAGEYMGSPVTEPLHFLIGRWDRTGPLGHEDTLRNWQDLDNLWLSVTPQTGLISAAELYADPASVDVNTGRSIPQTLSESRTYARETQISKGGR